jgi:hypothetical protein
MNKIRFTLRLPADLNDKLIERARSDGRSKNAQIIFILRQVLAARGVVGIEDERWLALKND